MRIDGTMQDNSSLMQRTGEAKEQGRNTHQKKEDVKSVQAQELNLGQDNILTRKKQAMKEAMSFIKDQFKADSEIDRDLAKRRGRIAENKEKANAALKEKNSLIEEQEKAKKTFGIEEDSEEQKDLELRLKYEEAQKPDSEVELTEEEWERYKNLGPITEYQQLYMDLEEAKSKWQKEIDEANKQIAIETKIIDATEQELLKYHGMTDAKAAAKATLEAASRELVGMLVQEGADKIQEDIDEAVEKGQDMKKKKEEEEEMLQNESKAQQQEAKLVNMEKAQQAGDEAKQRIQEILAKQKLLEEDLKGIKVDDVR